MDYLTDSLKSRLSSIFCCLPLQSKITDKLTFISPEPTYTFKLNEQKNKFVLHLFPSAGWFFTRSEIDRIFDVFFTKTNRGNKIACMYIKCVPDTKITILYSHENDSDLGLLSYSLYYLGSRIGCNIITYDYSGYGQSTGKPSEKNMYADMEATWDILQVRQGINPKHIVLYGQSIGTIPTIDLASRYKVAGVVLHSPLVSTIRTKFFRCKKRHFDEFSNSDKVLNIKSPVLIIHGTEDVVEDFYQAQSIYKKCSRAVEPLWIQGAGHNNIHYYKEYFCRLKKFVNSELCNIKMKRSSVLTIPTINEAIFLRIEK